MFVLTETLRASVGVAGRLVEAGDDRAVEAALTSACHAVEAYSAVAGAALLVHGGIGFTYEADIHFHLRRAYAAASLVGRPADLRAELVSLVG
jgi:alkylation response protein AidB-like acyl-CoA dehydrogenase